jgi:hypothetical protein
MNVDKMRCVVGAVKFPDYVFTVGESSRGFVYLQGSYDEADTITGRIERQYTRRWPLSPEMTKSEIVATAFKCVMTSQEHKCREWFTYCGAAIYQPHYDVDDLLAICEKRDTRLNDANEKIAELEGRIANALL